MTPSEAHVCGQCGRELPASSLGHRCPNCLLLLALTPPPEEFVAETPVLPAGQVAAGRRFFGSYELIEEISRGGMGVVYRARQFAPEREVALKMIHPACRATPAARLRFQVEVAAVARLHHPRIVSLYESGEQDGVCYYSMRLIQGVGLDKYLATGQAGDDVVARVDLLIKVAHAVHHAHERGILHRDLKPSNIIIAADGEPCIADFGLAKIQESDAGLTQDQAVLGSPSYMAPEQAAGKRDEVTTAADVYSLGAVLYEMLTGAPPFLAGTPLETLRQVVEQSPVPPSQRVPALSRDLESVCLKALEKEPSRRYASAVALAEDLERWRRGEPVLTRPITPLESAWRWCVRKPAWAALIALSLFALTGLAVGSTFVARRLKVAGDETQHLVRRLQHEKAESYLSGNETAKGLAVLAYLLRERPDDAVVGTRLMSALSQRSLAIPLVRPWVGGAETLAVSFTPDGRYSSAISLNGAFHRVELDSGQTWDAILAREGESLLLAAIHPDGAIAATAHPDGHLRLWRTLDVHSPFAELPHETPVKHMAFSVDTNLVATVDQQNNVRWWRLSAKDSGLASPTVSSKSDGWIAIRPSMPAGESVNAIAFSPSGASFAVATESGRVILMSTANSDAEPIVRALPDRVQVIAFDATGERLAATSGWDAVMIWVLNNPESALTRWDAHFAPTDLEFSPDGKYLAAAGWTSENQAFVWDTRTGNRITQRLVHRSHVTAVRFSPDSQELITLGHDNSARRWSTGAWLSRGETLVHVSTPLQIAFDGSGRRLVTGSYTGVVWWDLSPPRGQPVLLAHNKTVSRGAFSPDGTTVATGTADGRVNLWNLEDHTLRSSFNAQPDEVLALSYNHSGKQFVTFGEEGVARLWDARSGRPYAKPIPHPASIYSACFSPDDRCLLTAGTDGVARVWDIASGLLAAPLLRHGAPLRGAQFNQIGDRIVTYGRDNWLRMWNGQTGDAVGEPMDHRDWISDAEFSHDGRWLVAAGRDCRVRLWEAGTGRLVFEPMAHQNEVTMLSISPDGNWLASASHDASVQVVRLNPRGTPPILFPHPANLKSISFSPNSRWLVSLSQEGIARIWDPSSGLPLTEPLRVPTPASVATFSVEGSALMTLGGENAALWKLPQYRPDTAPTLAKVAELVGRMKMKTANHFDVPPVSDWPDAPASLDLSEVLYPSPQRRTVSGR